jgi:hypothetical protein
MQQAIPFYGPFIVETSAKALFSSKIFREKTVHFPSHRIFRHMHGALNIDKK